MLTPTGNNEITVGTANQSIANFKTFEQQSTSTDTLTTPFFPALYPRDYATEHLIQCNADKNATQDACRIRIIFTDFQIALDSTLEVSVLSLTPIAKQRLITN